MAAIQPSAAGLTRLARPDDAAAIAVIYNQGIDERIATFETEHRSPDEIDWQLRERSATHPAVVVEKDETVVGFAWASPYRTRACYAGIGEFSVYVAAPARAQGVGRAALGGLIAECDSRGFSKLVSRIFPENAPSRALCSRAGFREVGVYRRHGKLDGRWKDCVIVERLLGEAAGG